MNKYELTNETRTYKGITLYRIKALRNIDGSCYSGKLGGWIQREYNLSQEGECWVRDDAIVYGWGRVQDDAVVGDNARIYGNANIKGTARVFGRANVYGNALLLGDVSVIDHAKIYGNAVLRSFCRIGDNAKVYGNAKIQLPVRIMGNSTITSLSDIMFISGIRYDLTITPQNVMGGCRTFTHEEFRNLKPKDCQSHWYPAQLNHYKKFLDMYLKQRALTKGK